MTSDGQPGWDEHCGLRPGSAHTETDPGSDRMQYLYRIASVKRQYRLGLIDEHTYLHRLVAAIHEHAGVPE